MTFKSTESALQRAQNYQGRTDCSDIPFGGTHPSNEVRVAVQLTLNTMTTFVAPRKPVGEVKCAWLTVKTQDNYIFCGAGTSLISLYCTSASPLNKQTHFHGHKEGKKICYGNLLSIHHSTS